MYVYDSPEVIAVCLNCKRANCNGACDALRKVLSVDRETNQRTGDCYQQRTRRASKYLYNGELKTVAQWADTLGISRNALYAHLRNGESMASIINRFSGFKNRSAAPCITLEQEDETRRRLDAMRGDREFFDKMPGCRDSSAGMVASYGKVQSASTNRISSIVEDMAIAEANMPDEMLMRREWLRCAEHVLCGYMNQKEQKAGLTAFLMDKKVFCGWTVRRIQEVWESDRGYRPSHNCIYYRYSKIVHDVAVEALARGLFDTGGTSVFQSTLPVRE